jgi:hypothetical protein
MNIIDRLKIARRRALNAAASVNEYKKHWGTDFSFKELGMGFSNVKGFGYEAIPVITQSELKELDRDTLYEFGFGNWDDELVLIPLWLVGFMDKSESVTSITGKESTLAECNKDVRGGCIAWGFTKRQ